MKLFVALAILVVLLCLQLYPTEARRTTDLSNARRYKCARGKRCPRTRPVCCKAKTRGRVHTCLRKTEPCTKVLKSYSYKKPRGTSSRGKRGKCHRGKRCTKSKPVCCKASRGSVHTCVKTKAQCSRKVVKSYSYKPRRQSGGSTSGSVSNTVTNVLSGNTSAGSSTSSSTIKNIHGYTWNKPTFAAKKSKWVPNLGADGPFSSAFGHKYTTLNQALEVTNCMAFDPRGEKCTTVKTHVVPEPQVRTCAYDDSAIPKQPDIARMTSEGEVFIVIKNHVADHVKEYLKKPTSEAEGKKVLEFLKVFTTHIGVGVNVKLSDGTRGAITVNSPQGYQSGTFGGNKLNYPAVLARLRLPDCVKKDLVKHYMQNIRNWMVVVNNFLAFPPDYNGNDPMRTYTRAAVQEYGLKVVDAVLGDATAKSWLRSKEHMLYCAEFASVILNLGLEFPLTKEFLGAKYDPFYAALASPSAMNSANGNDHIGLVELGKVPDSIKPLHKLCNGKCGIGPDGIDNCMVLTPMNPFLVMQRFVTNVVHREEMGPANQAAAIKILAGVFMSMKKITGEKAVALNKEVDSIVKVVMSPHANRGDFLVKLRGAMKTLGFLMSPAHGSSDGEKSSKAFFPPHAFLDYMVSFAWRLAGHDESFIEEGNSVDAPKWRGIADSRSQIKLELLCYSYAKAIMKQA